MTVYNITTDMAGLGGTNAVGDGATDDTTAFRWAAANISSSDTVFVPKTNAFYRLSGTAGTGYTVSVGQNWKSDGARIFKPQNGDNNMEVFRCDTKTGLAIDGFILDGGYRGGDPSSGEYSHGILLHNCTSCTVSNNTVLNMSGDGIYLGASSSGYNSNCVVKGNFVRNSYRNSTAVISANGLIVDGNYLEINHQYNMNLDFEPDFTTQQIKNIVVSNNVLRNDVYDWNRSGIADQAAICFTASGNVSSPYLNAGQVDGIEIYNNDLVGACGIRADQRAYVNNITIEGNRYRQTLRFGYTGSGSTGDNSQNFIHLQYVTTAVVRGNVDYSSVLNDVLAGTGAYTSFTQFSCTGVTNTGNYFR